MSSWKLVLLLLVSYVDSEQIDPPFDTVVAFGDANTDTGNGYKLTDCQWPLVPPYYQGRFTNGPVWIENLDIPNRFNYAYIDATIDDNNLITGYTGPNRTVVPCIRQQIVMYLTSHDMETIDLSRTLYVIWAASSEYFTDSNLSADVVVDSLYDAIYDLLVVGAKHLIVMNLPPLHLYPGMNNNQRLFNLVTEHNNYLAVNMSTVRLEYSEVSLQIFDVYSLLTKILLDKSIPGLNRVDSCWNLRNYSIISQCANPNSYVFIDNYHLTRVIHQLIADHFQQLIFSSSKSNFSPTRFYVFICLIVFVREKYQ